LGTIALADFLEQNGHESKIVNVFVEKQIDNNFNLAEYAKNSGAKIFCLPLHWHFQTYDVIEAARKIKNEIPDSKIILGGFTATFFAEEILKEFNFVDFVIRGDAEKPLLNLIEENEEDYSKIPNLTWRKENKTISNSQTYKLNSEMLSSLSFTNFGLIEHFDEYKKLGLAKTDKENKWLFVYNPGVGCNVNCSYCGGSCISQKRLNGRETSIFIDKEKAVSELKKLAEHAMGVWYVCFDPLNDRKYYLELFKKIREEKIKIKCKFEAWSLPTKEFVDGFKETFAEGSEILLSPDTGSEKIRKLNKGFYYSNNELIESINYMGKKGVGCRLYFTAGLPVEEMKDFLETLLIINKIRNESPSTIIHSVPIEMEPAAPIFMDSKKYGITTKRKSIIDFYNSHKKQSDIGYSTGHFSEEEIPELANIARAAGQCMMKRPVFLKALAEAPFPIEQFPLKELWRLCAICRFFNECFAG